jgi:2-keto-4-pentenoate hydratase/2-oxohepta-3-ene-1,7-dioic acid hydratase in catechol pathway
MRLIRYQIKQGPICYGWILDDPAGNLVGPLEGLPFAGFRRLEAELPLDQVKLLAPVLPSKMICVGRNYVEHAREHGAEVPEIPLIFLKPSSCLLDPDGTILLPPQSQQVEHEGELVVVIGKTGRWIAPDQADEFVLGYTIGNDITARDLQRRDGQWTRAKGFDTFGPIGPWITTEFDPADAVVSCHVNGELRQMASTRDMVFSTRQLIAYISSVMTLLPGDLIFTGTPAGVGALLPGDVVEVTIEGLGTLRNTVAAQPVH